MKNNINIIFIFFLFCFLFIKNGFAYYDLGSPTGYVNDYAGIFLEYEKYDLEQTIENFQKTSDYEISVVTIRSLQKDTIENFANQLFIDWNMSDKTVLFLAAIDDGKIQIKTGNEIKNNLNDLQIFWIQDTQVKPFFSGGKYFEGIKVGVNKTIAGLAQTEIIPDLKTDQDSNLESPWISWLMIAGIGIFVLVIVVFLYFTAGSMGSTTGSSSTNPTPDWGSEEEEEERKERIHKI